jgi:hypothetical protein
MNYALMYALSPLGTALNTAMLAAAMLALGADATRKAFWLTLVIFVLASGVLDLRAYRARRRRGLSAYEATEALTNAVWGPPPGRRQEEA